MCGSQCALKILLNILQGSLGILKRESAFVGIGSYDAMLSGKSDIICTLLHGLAVDRRKIIDGMTFFGADADNDLIDKYYDSTDKHHNQREHERELLIARGERGVSEQHSDILEEERIEHVAERIHHRIDR